MACNVSLFEAKIACEPVPPDALLFLLTGVSVDPDVPDDDSKSDPVTGLLEDAGTGGTGEASCSVLCW